MLDLSLLNKPQKEAVTAPEGPLLVIAGAGSGKTRTIVYRLAWLAEQGCAPHSMLLLTFTRKAAQEMLHRASQLLDEQLLGVQGGTFHSFAFSVLRRYPPSWSRGPISIMDTADSTAALKTCKDTLNIGKGDRTFPQKQAVLALISKARNKELPLEDVLSREAQHLLPHASDLEQLAEAYQNYKREHALLDYDDLLFELERLFLEQPEILRAQQLRFHQVMVDEYQDTNKVQARLVRLLAGERGNVMAVGDDAQSIYAFRGATVRNILEFPKLFEGTHIIRLEENYRSVQPVLDVANDLLAHSTEGYQKHLFSRRPVPEEKAVTLYRPLSDLSQAQLAARRIEELLETHQPGDIAVLFRSGYQSYHLEVELKKRAVGFRKYGGLRYAEAAHVKDVMAFARLVVNPLDLPSFDRIAALSKGIGPKTSRRLFELSCRGDEQALNKACGRWPDFRENMALIAGLRMEKVKPEDAVLRILEHYRPKMEELFPDDWPRHLQGLEEMSSIASGYEDLQLFVADISLDNPEEDQEDDGGRSVTLSTVHSAKGLEWPCVLIIDLVEDRFPSRHAAVRPEDFEEERRLMYVACTRAKDTLDLFSPLTLYNRAFGGQEPATPSTFIRELSPDRLDEIYEGYGGVLSRRTVLEPPRSERRFSGQYGTPDETSSRLQRRDEEERSGAWPPQRERTAWKPDIPPSTAAQHGEEKGEEGADEWETPKAERKDPSRLGFCRHRIFGRGKIVEEIPPGKYRVNFPGLGLKIILADYLILEKP